MDHHYLTLHQAWVRTYSNEIAFCHLHTKYSCPKVRGVVVGAHGVLAVSIDLTQLSLAVASRLPENCALDDLSYLEDCNREDILQKQAYEWFVPVSLGISTASAAELVQLWYPKSLETQVRYPRQLKMVRGCVSGGHTC